MPVIGSFHHQYWRARANVPPPPGTANPMQYPLWQSSRGTTTFGMAIWGVPLDALRPIWRQARWLWAISRRLWHWRSAASQARLEAWIDRLEALEPDQRAALERAHDLLTGPYWPDACERVRVCMTTPKFHQPEQWVIYSRAVKADAGQAQNVWRHMRIVHELKAAFPISNPDAHFVTELAYQAVAAASRPGVIVDHPVLHRRSA